MVSSFLIQIIVLAACFQKAGSFAMTATACKNCMRLAASCIQIAPEHIG
jgi:hypothetical protein